MDHLSLYKYGLFKNLGCDKHDLAAYEHELFDGQDAFEKKARTHSIFLGRFDFKTGKLRRDLILSSYLRKYRDYGEDRNRPLDSVEQSPKYTVKESRFKDT